MWFRLRVVGLVSLLVLAAVSACGEDGTGLQEPGQERGNGGRELSGLEGGRSEMLPAERAQTERLTDDSASEGASSEPGQVEPVGMDAGPTDNGIPEVAMERSPERVDPPEPVIELRPEPQPEPQPELPPEPQPNVGPQPPLGNAITNATPGQWTWVDVVGSKCGYGDRTGFAVNPSPKKTDLVLIYIQGGGACWKRTGTVGDCFALAPTALNLRGYNGRTFRNDPVTQTNLGGFIFQRNRPANVFADAHMVWIPYCTGDVFVGNATIRSLLGRTMYFHGHTNMKLFLQRIVPTFPQARRVIVSGSSAGGFGAALNWWLVQQFFGNKVRVDVLDDSGPPMDPVAGRWDEWMKAWTPVFPPNCPDCVKGPKEILAYYQKNLMSAGRTFGLISYDRDAVIRTFFGLGDLTGTRFRNRLFGLYDEMDKIPGAQYFGIAGSGHTTLILNTQNISNDQRTPLTLWMEWMIKDDPAWKSWRK